MRPTFSIIAFTVLSGTGYGLWFVLGLMLASSRATCRGEDPCTTAQLASIALVCGFVLVATGLVCSLGHLGQPQRAWRALSQWRSSWLSREGVAALATFAPATVLLVAAFVPLPLLALRVCGFALMLGSFVTVYCTAHIYASLQPVRAWHDRRVAPAYALLGLHGGMLCLWLIASALQPVSLARVVIVLSIACALVKWRYWWIIDRLPAIDAGRATGLDRLGATRSFEQPHTEENYLTHEMGFALARKHAAPLRMWSLLLGFGVPGALALLAIASPTNALTCAAFALPAGLLGLFIERWLFFAQAKHAVIAYYGR